MTEYDYKPHQKSFNEGYEAGKNGWRYSAAGFEAGMLGLIGRWGKVVGGI